MDICNLSAVETARLFAEKKISAVEITNEYLKRIEKQDEKVKAYITVCAEEARRIAERADRERSSGISGVPVSVKDNFCTKGIRTTCASKMLENYVPMYDATVVAKIRESALPVLGKVNMDEFAMGAFGDSSAFFQTQNPIGEGFVPGGSSCGSAASVAAGLACASVGSDTGGSVRIPAAFCGLVGFKPTYGAISRYGLVAYASSLDTVGVITKTVDDAILISSVLFGRDNRDMTSRDVSLSVNEEITLKDIVFACSERDLVGADCDIQNAVSNVWSVLSKNGAKRITETVFDDSKADEAYAILACAEATSNLARYDGVKFGAYDGNDIFDVRNKFFGDEVKNRIRLGNNALNADNFDRLYKASAAERERASNEVNSLFERADIIVSPLSDFCVPRFEETGNCRADRFTVVANFAGIPAVSIPVGHDSRGMPISVQIMSKKCDDSKLLAVAKLIGECLQEAGV